MDITETEIANLKLPLGLSLNADVGFRNTVYYSVIHIE
jgi:hypothetical protein